MRKSILKYLYWWIVMEIEEKNNEIEEIELFSGVAIRDLNV